MKTKDENRKPMDDSGSDGSPGAKSIAVDSIGLDAAPKTSLISITSSSSGIEVHGLPKGEPNNPEQLVRTIVQAVVTSRIDNANFAEVSSRFFFDPEVQSKRINTGVVETPVDVAGFMAKSALQCWQRHNGKAASLSVLSNLVWLDPCVGAGVFPCAILSLYLKTLGATHIWELPVIKICETVPIGLVAALCNIKLLLEQHQIDFGEFVSEQRIRVTCGDFLRQSTSSRDFFDKRDAVDIVIGNPPYVRSTRIKQQRRKELRELFPTVYSGNADLYTYFLAGGINCLRPKGVLAYISPASFSRAKSGQKLRRWMKPRAALDSFFDLDESHVFPDADLHAAIYLLVRDIPQSVSINHLVISNPTELKKACNDQRNPKKAVFELNTDVWSIHRSKRAYTSFANTFSDTVTLKELGVNVYSGIRPGYRKAFIISKDVYLHLRPEVREEWVRPIALASKIQRWSTKTIEDYIIVIPAGVEQVDCEIISLLSKYKDRLIARPEVRDARFWHNLRPCTYYHLMNKAKIGFPDLSSRQRFSIIEPGTFLLDGAYFIDTDDKVLLAILNSEIAKAYFAKRCSSVGSLSSNGRFRFKKTFVQDFPVPPAIFCNGQVQNEIRKTTASILRYGENEDRMARLNCLVTDFYG